MNVLNIALFEIKKDLRDKRTLIFMLAFPIVLILILGTALTNAFHNGVELGDMKLLVKNTAQSQQLQSYWNGFAQAIGKEGVELTPAANGIDGKKAVQDNQYTAYAEIDDNGIHFYGSSRETISSNIIQGMLTSFADKYSLAAAAVKNDPEAAHAIIAGEMAPGSFIQESSLDPDRKPGSIDYYAIVESTMIAFYACMSASWLIRGEVKRKTALRLAAAPVGKLEIFAGKVIASTIINFLCILVVVLFSKFVFNANWGDHLGPVFLLLFTEVLLAVSFGLGIAFLFKDDAAVNGVMMIFVQLASMFGGAYFPVDEASGFFAGIANLSPLRWANEALMNLIYNDDLQAVFPVMGLNTAIAAAFLAFVAITMRKREAF
ncbi:ABC transporter permease [Paenibacillus glycanilyticus]|uniref:ABC transporter permease n=1 Tax=Paenibacillus glycanilyticus TaxID=126569 RepID=UPI0020409FFC|nr:ABC transporter permease [Paenibacillus glycanilyticus]MCM3626207.1 ABC transporter permease [Paenibacillus glycanilyticus]